MGEIDLRIASLDDPIEPTDDPADMVPEVPAAKIGAKRHLISVESGR